MVARQGKAVPVGVIQLRMIGSIVIAQPPRFLSEHHVLRDAFQGQDPVVEFPRPHELVKVFGSEMVEVFLQYP